MTDNGGLSDCEKTIMNPDEPIYGDLITEIELEDDATTDDKEKESLTDIIVTEQNNEPGTVTTDIPTESEPFVTSDVLSQDDAVSEFFAVDSKPDDFDNDMLISELDSEGIDFKNETDVAECHHEYESKKLLEFADCEDIVEVVNNDVVQQEVIAETETLTTTPDEKIETNPEDNDPCFGSATDESLNRMHVMEDVEEGCDVSGALPSSPGHAEQRPDPPKSTPELLTLPPKQTPPPTENGLPAEETKPNENGKEAASPETIETPQEVQEQQQQQQQQQEEEEPKEKAVEQIQEEATTNDKNEPQKIEMVIEILKANSPVSADIQKESVVKGEQEEDSTSSDSSPESVQSSNKRKIKDEDSSSVTPTKKLRTQIQQQYINHDRILTEYIETSGWVSVDDLQVHTEQLLAEIRTLNELAREKEREWNNILHVKKVKEELLLRMQRKKQVMLMNSGAVDKNEVGDWDVSGSDHQEIISDRGKDCSSKQSGMMVPDVSSSPAGSVSSRSGCKEGGGRQDKVHTTKQRSILPKTMGDLNGQGECRQGRQGPILDVRSIIADYRQRHPETVPRRGRRQKSVLNTANNDTAKGSILSMASLALGSGSQVRHGTAADMSNELGMLLSAMDSARQENSRPSSADSSVTSALGGVDAATSFKDVLVQFARLSQSERQELHAAANLAVAASSKPPPPPYPEVTLHPVPPVVSSATIPTSQNSSLLHGILTKSQPRSDSKPTTFSPTLARLLTAPERVSSNNAQAVYTAALNSGVSISDLLSTGKDEDEAEDSADRLVIDEGNEISGSDRNRTDNGSEAGDEVPQCQGCHQKSAQFVCAGCGNQWYCSRDCQVAAWDEHSEVCSG